jgi:hypothetical protein
MHLDPHDEQAHDRLFLVLCEVGLLHGRLHDYRVAADYNRRAVALGDALAPTDSRPNVQFADR